MIRFLTAGESHGKALTTIVDGFPSNLKISESYINQQLKRRQFGYGRGLRMKIESDKAEILSGVRFGKTLGSPISMLIRNADWSNWQTLMSVDPINQKVEKISIPRPGHADLVGVSKYNFDDIRNSIERSSARETAARVAAGTIAKKLLEEFGITIGSFVESIGGIYPERNFTEKLFNNTIPSNFSAQSISDKADNSLVRVLDSTQDNAVKAVEIGEGFLLAEKYGSKSHDEIIFKKDFIGRKTNRAGGIEGGVSTGLPIIVRAAMKPIATLMSPIESIDLSTMKKVDARRERSDFVAVPACAVIAESMLAWSLAKYFLLKFGGDSLEELKDNYSSYNKKLLVRVKNNFKR